MKEQICKFPSCGNPVKPGRTFCSRRCSARAGAAITHKRGLERAEAAERSRVLCGCGCGVLAKAGNKFILGHHSRVHHYGTAEGNKRISEAKKRYWEDVRAGRRPPPRKRAPLPDETKEKLGAIGRNFWIDVEEGRRESPFTDEWRKAHSERQKLIRKRIQSGEIALKPQFCTWCEKWFVPHDVGKWLWCSKTCKKQGQRFRRYEKKYGVTREEYEEFMAEDKCLLCEKEAVLVLDHDHETGAIRGALCRQCNNGLGHFYDRADVMLRASLYIEGRLPKEPSKEEPG